MDYKNSYNDEMDILARVEKIKNNKLSEKEKKELEELKKFCASYPIEKYL